VCVLHLAGHAWSVSTSSYRGVKVDPEWLAHKKFGGPSAELMRALDVPDPLVSLHLSYTPCMATAVLPTATTGGGAGAIDGAARNATGAARGATGGPTAKQQQQQLKDYLYNSEYGLRHSVHPDSLLPQYRCDINMDQVFGRFDPLAALHLGSSEVMDFERESMMELIGSAHVL
jgi:hypothetical protein